MDEILYLEPDEEITSVVDKLKGLEADSVGLVAPKGSSIVQSLVSLKLLQKQAKALGKEIAIVTSDEVGQNLASRIELPVYADVRSKKPIEPKEQKEPVADGPIEITDEPEETTEAAAVLAAEKAEAATEKAQEKAQEEVKAAAKEEYKDLPKNFEVHRFDEPNGEQAEEEVEEAAEEMAEEEPSEPQGKNTDYRIHNTGRVREEAEAVEEPKFINRPLSEKKRDDRMELESARPMIHEKRQVINPKKENNRKMIWATLTIALLIVALLLGDLAFSKLTINMSIPADPITKEAVVTIQKDHPNPDFENGIIGGTQIDKEVSIDGTYSATGSKETGNPAKGNLTIQNELGTDVAVGAGATVRSGGGVSFKTDAAVTVPKATLDAGGNKVLGRTTIAVTAAQPGGTSNLPANTSYVVEGKTGISLTGATSGGTSQKVKIVNQSDIDSAKKDLAAKAVERFKTETKADADIVLLDEAFTSEASSFTTTKNANDQVDNFNATAKVRVVTMTFSKKDFNKAVQTIASKDVPDGKSLLVTEQDQVEQTLQDKQLNVGQLKVKGTLNSHIGPKVDLEKLIAGFRVKPIKKIRQEVEAIPEARVGDIILSPSFALPFGPLIKKNTQIKIEYTNK